MFLYVLVRPLFPPYCHYIGSYSTDRETHVTVREKTKTNGRNWIRTSDPIDVNDVL